MDSRSASAIKSDAVHGAPDRPCDAEVLEWEPPWRAVIRLSGLLEATVTTAIASLPFERSVLRHEVTYRFRGPLGGIGAQSIQAVGGSQLALKRGVLAQKREIEEELGRPVAYHRRP